VRPVEVDPARLAALAAAPDRARHWGLRLDAVAALLDAGAAS
jgi:O-succinylbenzoate synthase